MVGESKKSKGSTRKREKGFQNTKRDLDRVQVFHSTRRDRVQLVATPTQVTPRYFQFLLSVHIFMVFLRRFKSCENIELKLSFNE